MSHTRSLCIIYWRKPEFKFLACLESIDDAAGYVQRMIALAMSGANKPQAHEPRLLKWVRAEAIEVTIPDEVHLVFPEGMPDY